MHEQVNGAPVIRFGPFTLDGRSGELRNGPTRLKVPDQSVAVLQALLERPGELVTREALRDRLWGPDTFVDFEAGLNAAVRRLREALNDSADVPRYVETLPRRGYRFIAPVDGARDGCAARSTADIGGRRGSCPRAFRYRPDRTSPAAASGAGDHCSAVIGSAVWFGLSLDMMPRRTAREARADHQLPGIGAPPGDLSRWELRRLCLGGRGWGQLRHLRPIDRWQLSAAPDDHAAADFAPAWSPDGLRIAFVRDLDGTREIIVLPSFGGREQQLLEAGPE